MEAILGTVLERLATAGVPAMLCAVAVWWLLRQRETDHKEIDELQVKLEAAQEARRTEIDALRVHYEGVLEARRLEGNSWLERVTKALESLAGRTA